MSNNKTKGNRNQLKCIRELESSGWLVDKVEKTGRFAKIKDLYGLFDIVCVKKNKTLYVQITTNKPHTHKNYQSFARKYGGKNLLVEQWVWYDRRGWRKIVYQSSGKKKVIDERN